MSKKNKDNEISYEIKAVHGYLNKKQNKVLVSISWNGRDPQLEIRSCWMKDDKLHIGKGISLSDEEIDKLSELLKLAQKNKLLVYTESGKKAVDFDDIFESSGDILEKRAQGYTTEDGFIKLSPIPGGRFARRNRNDS